MNGRHSEDAGSEKLLGGLLPVQVRLSAPKLGTLDVSLQGGRTLVWTKDGILDYDFGVSSGLDPKIAETDWFENAWFLRELETKLEDLLTKSGFDLAQRRLCAEGLRIAFPAEVCRVKPWA